MISNFVVIGFLSVFVLGTFLTATNADDDTIKCPEYDFEKIYNTRKAEYLQRLKALNDKKPAGVNREPSVSVDSQTATDGTCKKTITVVKEGKTKTLTSSCSASVRTETDVVKTSDGTCVSRTTVTVNNNDYDIDGAPFDCEQEREERDRMREEWEDWTEEYNKLVKAWNDIQQDILRLRNEDLNCQMRKEQQERNNQYGRPRQWSWLRPWGSRSGSIFGGGESLDNVIRDHIHDWQKFFG